MKRLLGTLVILGLWALPAHAQITMPYTFSANTDILSAEVNANFNAVATSALKRDGSGTVTGNLSVDANITIDGADISDYLDGSGNLTVAGTTATLRGVAYTLPAADGTSGYVLSTNGSGTLSWASKAGALLDGSLNSDTLAGNVTRGDLIIGNSTPKWAELALGTASKVLRSDGTDVSWSWPGLSSQGSSFSAGDGVDYYLVTATATATLPACNAGRSGKWFHFKLTAASSTVTIDGDGSETIDGAATYAFSERYTSISIVCNGSGAWSIF